MVKLIGRGGAGRGQGKKPASPEKVARDKTIQVRLTETEKARIMRAARYNRNGWTAAEWLRNVLWNAAVDADMIAEIEHEKHCE